MTETLQAAAWRSIEHDTDRATAQRAAADEPTLEVADLRVSFGTGARRTEVVKGISFKLRRGESLAIVGESGSGKSVTARTLIGLTGPGSTVSASKLTFGSVDLRGFRERDWRALRGKGIGFVLQDALVSLDPLRPSGKEVEEALKVHRFGNRTDRHRRVIEVLGNVGVPEPDLRARQRSGELSGGLRQRALIASGLVLDPPLLIADEPTTALDTTVQAQVIAILNAAKARGKSLLLISHDLGVVGRLADNVLVMRHGEAVEFGSAESVLGDPQEEYTKSLLGAIPSARTRGRRLSAGAPSVSARRAHADRPAGADQPAPDGTRATPIERSPSTDRFDDVVLSVRNISKSFRSTGGAQRAAVVDLSFDLRRGETVGVVGESGSGKTTTARIALGLVAPDAGTVLFDGQPWSDASERIRRAQRRRISVVYQDPLGSFDPRWTVGDILNDALAFGSAAGRDAKRERIAELLDQVGLARSHFGRRPLTLSGGQRQRVAIARAIAAQPEVIVLDEPVSALDVSIQAQILDLFTELQRELGLSYLFISHDLGVISHMSDRVIVMKDGRVVESGTSADVFERPQHDYTKALLSAVPSVGAGIPPDPAAGRHPGGESDLDYVRNTEK